jgi:hypothetical protein
MEKEFEKTEYPSEGLRLTILGCFRYSLGRRTYMPSHTVGIIKQYRKIFNKQDWERFIEEINQCKDLGNECDIQTWNKLKEFSEEQLKLIRKKNGG